MAEQRHNSGIVKAEQPAVQADDDTRRRAARRKTSLPFCTSACFVTTCSLATYRQPGMCSLGHCT